MTDETLGARVLRKLRKIVEECPDCQGKGWVTEGARHGSYAINSEAPWDVFLCGGPCMKARELLEMPKPQDPEFLRMREARRKWDMARWR